MEALGTGRYNIENVQSGQCLDVTGGSTADGRRPSSHPVLAV